MMEVYWIWLSTLRQVGPITQKRLIAHFRQPKAVFQATEEELQSIKGLSKKAIYSIVTSKSLKDSEEIAKKLSKKSIGFLHYHDPLYPVAAKSSKESPVLLYYKGHLKPFNYAIGVVGSRRCTSYGRNLAEDIGEKLAKLQVPLISGFAKGIDSYVHAACIQNGGYPIVFLAGGVDVCYPKEQQSLYDQILESDGVILSQYPPGSPPKPKQFLQRNALISAWSDELIVVEASKNSGALWTANFMKNNGKNVYAVPNQIHVPEGAGTNQLLEQGAIPYLGIDSLQTVRHVIDNKRVDNLLKQEYSPILSLLSESPQSTTELAIHLKTNEHDLMDQLLTLELERKVMIRGNIVKML